MEGTGRAADADLMHPDASGIPLEDDPALAPHHTRKRRLWYLARYLPVAALGAVAVSPLPSAASVALVLAIPPLIWALALRAGLSQGQPAAQVGNGRAVIARLARAHLNLCIWALCIGLMGIWASPAVIPLIILCLSTARVNGASALDVARLPALCRAMVETTPGVRALTAPDRPGCPHVFAHRDAIYLSERSLLGDPDHLTIPIAREVAHLRLGHRGMSPAGAVQMGVASAIGWLIAVSLGALPFTYHLPPSGFAAASATLAAAMFGLSVGLALTDPIMLRRSRRRERAADDLALNLIGDGVAYAAWLWSDTRACGEPLWPTRLQRAVTWREPPAGERIERALAHGSRPPTPSLLPAGHGGRPPVDRHRHAMLAGAWVWLLLIAWILGKLHPGGMIH
jgi:hypothetical protein